MPARRLAATLGSLAFTILTAALLALVLLGPGSGEAAVNRTPAPTAAPLAEQPAAQPVELEDATAQQDAFIADLFGPDLDVTPEQAFALAELAQRVCHLLSDPTGVPAGAEIPTRESMVETFTLPTPSLTTGWTVDEANKFLDTAAATYCPTLLVSADGEQDASL